MTERFEVGSAIALPLTDRPGDTAVVRVLGVPRRDLLIDGVLPDPLVPFAEAVLVDVTVDGRTVLPGAWIQPRALDAGEPCSAPPVTAADLRLPAVVHGDGSQAELHWGATRWPLPFDDSVEVPRTCRASAHSSATLRRLALVAAGRRHEIPLTIWRDPAFEIPWHDVRLAPRASWWFELAQVPLGMRYRDALASQFTAH